MFQTGFVFCGFAYFPFFLPKCHRFALKTCMAVVCHQQAGLSNITWLLPEDTSLLFLFLPFPVPERPGLCLLSSLSCRGAASVLSSAEFAPLLWESGWEEVEIIALSQRQREEERDCDAEWGGTGWWRGGGGYGGRHRYCCCCWFSFVSWYLL